MRRSRNPAGSSSGLRATWILSTNTPKSRAETVFGRRLGSLSFNSIRWTERARAPVRVCANGSRSVSQRPRGTSTNRTGDSTIAPRRTRKRYSAATVCKMRLTLVARRGLGW